MYSIAAAGVAAAIPRVLDAQGGRAAAGASAVRAFRIDTHSHFSIPKLYKLATDRGVQQATLADWSPDKMLKEMDEGAVQTSIISISDPGVHFGDNMAARALARECNEYAAKVIADHPGRFGLFAVLPLPDVDGALREAEYALDTLKADGIGVLSSYEGKYLGNPVYDPLLVEMNRRKAIIYCHPYCAACGAQQTLTDAQNRGVEFVFDTTRTILSLLQTGQVAKYPDITFIWSHGGGTMPYITSRFGAAKGPDGKPNETLQTIQKFYYDTAQAYNPYTLEGFTRLIPNSHIFFGSDYLGNAGSAGNVIRGLDAYTGFTPQQRQAIYRDNALKLFPRFARA